MTLEKVVAGENALLNVDTVTAFTTLYAEHIQREEDELLPMAARLLGITELAAGFKSGRHSHPGQVLAYVAEGEFWYLVDGQPERIYKVGESLQLPDRAIHNEGAAGGNPVKVFAVFVVEKGQPMVQPAQPPQ